MGKLNLVRLLSQLVSRWVYKSSRKTTYILKTDQRSTAALLMVKDKGFGAFILWQERVNKCPSLKEKTIKATGFRTYAPSVTECNDISGDATTATHVVYIRTQEVDSLSRDLQYRKQKYQEFPWSSLKRHNFQLFLKNSLWTATRGNSLLTSLSPPVVFVWSEVTNKSISIQN